MLFINLILAAWHWLVPPQKTTATDTITTAPKIEPLIAPTMSTSPSPTVYAWDTQPHARHSTRLICDEMGLSVEKKNRLCACIFQESSFKPNAIGKPNRNGTVDYGLCQYNNGTIRGVPLWIGPGAAFKDANEVLTSPEKNVRIMIKTVEAGHWNWWSSFSTGAYKQWLPGVSSDEAFLKLIATK